MHWYVDVLKKYVTFDGRAGRPEFWMFTLINLIITIVLLVLDVVLGTDPFLHLVYTLAVLLPGLAVGARRLHDTGLSGWWQLIILIPILGSIALLILCARAGKPDANAYGPAPQEVPAQ